MVKYLPKEILPGDLLAGARFNIQTSACLTKKETQERDRQVYGPKGARAAMLWFHNHGYGNAGATSGHLIPDYGRIIREGWKAVHAELEPAYAALSPSDSAAQKGRTIARHADRCHHAARPGCRIFQRVHPPGADRLRTRSAGTNCCRWPTT